MNKTDKILITGASGLIGSALVRLLMAEGYENLLTPSHLELDMEQQLTVEEYLYKEKPDYIFHLAAHVGGIQDNNRYPFDFITKNTLMQSNLFDSCARLKIKKVLFPGSACAYPRDAEQPIKESAFLTGIPEPTNLAYAVAKQNGIVMAQSYAMQYGMSVVLPMVANTYGIGDKSTHVIPQMIEKIKSAKEKNEFPIIWGTGQSLREFIYSEDVASAFLFLMLNYNSSEIINVGTGEEISINGLRHIIMGLLRYESDVINDHRRPDGAPRKCLDSSRIRAMGWEPKVSLKEGLRRVINQ